MKDDNTLMIAGVRVPEKTAIPKRFADYSASLITMSVISFQMFCDPNDKQGNDVCVPFSLGGDPSRKSPSIVDSIMARKWNWLVYAYPGYQARGVLLTRKLQESKFSFNVLNRLRFTSTQSLNSVRLTKVKEMMDIVCCPSTCTML
jgi:hypothetical protein